MGNVVLILETTFPTIYVYSTIFDDFYKVWVWHGTLVRFLLLKTLKAPSLSSSGDGELTPTIKSQRLLFNPYTYNLLPPRRCCVWRCGVRKVSKCAQTSKIIWSPVSCYTGSRVHDGQRMSSYSNSVYQKTLVWGILQRRYRSEGLRVWGDIQVPLP